MQRQPDGTPVAAEDLLRLPVFKDISPQFLKKNANATVWRHFKRGDIVCREGEFGSTAFYILEGKASVALATPIAHVKAQGRPGRLSRAADQQAHEPPAAAPGRPPRRRSGPALDSDRRPCRPGLRPSRRRTRAGRTVRRNDLHELLPALRDRARGNRLHDARDAAQRSRRPAKEQSVPRATRRNLPAPRARFAFARCSDFSRPHAGFHRPPARPRRTACASRPAR